MFTLEDWERRHPQYTPKATAENEKRYRDMERIAAEVAERDMLIEMSEMAEEAAMVERDVFGCIEFEPQFNWNAKSTPDERGWSRAMVDIIAFEGEDAEPLFELF